jgi:hypothetical protein
VRYRLPQATHVRLTLYDIMGRQVATLVDDDRAAGDHSISMDATHLAAGIYHYRLDANGTSLFAKAVLLK